MEKDRLEKVANKTSNPILKKAIEDKSKTISTNETVEKK